MTYQFILGMLMSCSIHTGVIFAQDFEAFERRLVGAVEAGEILPRQGTLILETLGRSGSNFETELKRRYKKASGEIEAGVVAGRVTRDEAELKLIRMRETMLVASKEGDLKDHRRDWKAEFHRYSDAVSKYKKDVDAGELSEEAAFAHLVSLRESIIDGIDWEYSDDDSPAVAKAKLRRKVSASLRLLQLRDSVFAED